MRIWTPRGRARPWLKVVLAVYVAAVAMLPFAHHDLACHLKSSTHCTACVVGASGETAHQRAGVAETPLTLCGLAPGAPVSPVVSIPDGVVAGRSPPARG